MVEGLQQNYGAINEVFDTVDGDLWAEIFKRVDNRASFRLGPSSRRSVGTVDFPWRAYKQLISTITSDIAGACLPLYNTPLQSITLPLDVSLAHKSMTRMIEALCYIRYGNRRRDSNDDVARYRPYVYTSTLMKLWPGSRVINVKIRIPFTNDTPLQAFSAIEWINACLAKSELKIRAEFEVMEGSAYMPLYSPEVVVPMCQIAGVDYKIEIAYYDLSFESAPFASEDAWNHFVRACICLSEIAAHFCDDISVPISVSSNKGEIIAVTLDCAVRVRRQGGMIVNCPSGEESLLLGYVIYLLSIYVIGLDGEADPRVIAQVFFSLYITTSKRDVVNSANAFMRRISRQAT